MKFYLEIPDEIVVKYEIDADMIDAIEKVLIKLAGLIASYYISVNSIF